MNFKNLILPLDWVWLFFFVTIVIFFGLSFKGKWISQQVLLTFLLSKIFIGIGLTLETLVADADIDAINYYYIGEIFADRFIQLVAGESFDYLYITPFFGLDGISTDRMASLTGFLLAISGNSFLFSTLVFSMLAGIGHLLLFRHFCSSFPQLKINSFYPVLFHLSALAWTSQLTKDSLGFFALGLACFNLEIFLKNRSIFNLILFIGGVYIALLFRSFLILLIILNSIGSVWKVLIEPSVLRARKLTGFSFLFILFCACLVIFSSVFLIQTFGKEIVEEQVKMNFTYQDLESESTFNNAQLSLSFSGFLALFEGVINTLFRPFIWEVTKSIQMVAAIENLVVLSFFVWGLFNYFYRLDTHNKFKIRFYLCNSLLVILVGSAGIGIFSSNSGTISRYRVPVIPFFLVIPCVILGFQNLNLKVSAPLSGVRKL